MCRILLVACGLKSKDRYVPATWLDSFKWNKTDDLESDATPSVPLVWPPFSMANQESLNALLDIGIPP